MLKQKYQNINFFITFFRKKLISIFLLFFIICLIMFSKENIISAKNGLKLWANNVVPTLFPFFIATELLGYTDFVKKIGKILEPVMRPLFNVPGIGSFPLIMGIISRISYWC